MFFCGPIDFLKKGKKVKWFVDCVNEIKFSKSIMLGIMNKAYGNEEYVLTTKASIWML